MWVYFFVSALVYCATNAHGFCVAHSNIFPRTSAKGDEANGHQLQNLLSSPSSSDIHETVQDWREHALLEDNSVSQHIPHKTGKALPSKNNLLSKVSFSWASELLATGNKRPLELPDLWTLNQKQQMHWTSQSFQRRYHRELERQAHLPTTPKSRRNILADFYASPIARAILSMYKREFLSSGLVKAVNSAVQFLPAVLISRILKLASKLQTAPHPTAASKDLMLLAVVLFAVLSMKTLIENMYFDMVTNLSSQVRGTLSAAIYQKALRLGPEGRQNTTLGEIVNYMQIDTARLEYVTGSIHTLWDGLFQIMGYSALLLYHLGPAVFAGILAMLFIVPFNAYHLRKLSRIREENLKASDHRVKLTNEIFQGIRAIKSYNWEQPFQTRLHGVREEELKWITAAANVRGVLIAALFAAPSFVAVVSLSTYALLGNAIDPAKVFTSLALFNQLRFPLTFLPMLINSLAEGKISLQRLDRFFALKEVSRYVQRTPPPDQPPVAIAIEGGHFGWTSASMSASADADADAIDLHRSQLEDVDLHIRPGELVAVIGPTGCGKTALLSALLGEMVKLNGTVTVAGRVAYVPQSPWIPNDSLKNVVLFGRPMDTRRYFDALRVCGLLKDLDQMGSSRDETEIGERGTNLSGGQKQRTSLARAVYEDADVYLLDDPLSALDNEVGFDVFRDCIKVSLRKKTRVLVTHNLNVLPDVDRIVLMAPADGQRGCRIVDQGTLRELLWRGHDLASYVQPASTAGFSDDVSEASATAAKRVEAVHSGGGGGGGGGGESSASAVALQRLSSLAEDGSGDHGNHGDAASAGPATIAAAAAAAVSGASMVTGTVASSPVAPLDMPVDSVASNLAASASAATGASSLLTEEEQREVFASQYPSPSPPPPSDDEDAAAASAGSALLGGSETAGTAAPSPTAPHPAATVAVTATTSPTSASSLVMRNRWRPFTSQQFETEYSAFLAKSTAASTALQHHQHQHQQRSGASTTVRTGPTAASRGSSWAMYHAYLTEARKPWLLLSIALAFVLANVSQVWQQWIVAAWTSDVGYQRHSLHVYLAGVAWMAVGVASFTWLRSYLGILLGAEASRHLHARMVQRTLRAPLSFFETTPIGRLIQRFSKDLDQIDQQLPASMAQLISSTLNIATSLLAICLVTPSFAPVMLVVLAIYVGVTNYYRPVARELKRLDGVSRSPIYSHFSETLQGLPVLRAFQREAMSQRINAGRLDDNVATYFALKAADRWLSFRLETLGNGIVLLSVLLAVVSRSRAGATGLSLTNALGITGLLNWAVRNAAETESLMHSVERVYATIRDTPQEAAATVAHVTLSPEAAAVAAGSSSVPEDVSEDVAEAPTVVTEEALCRDGWPWAGHIAFDNVTMRYRPDLAPVLRGIDLHIRPGERVGIVGRTGSGKSSLFRGLQRLSELDPGSGPIRIDGVDIGQLGIDTVRQAISIIPQDPVLFSDTIRNNLDPQGRFTDAALWDALHKSNLGYLVASLPGGLQYRVTEGGENFSAGQRQLLCLARALVRRSKILLLDEATSSVDFETDALIQGTIRREFHRKATVLTIAHRLDTVLDADRIVVIDAGRVVECDTPPALLRRPHSLFTQLVQAEQAQRLSHG